MKGCRRILIRRGTNWEDVTDKSAIIYGAGQGCLDLMNEWQVPNVKYVIDSDKDKWGKRIFLLGQIYLIRQPDFLSNLLLEKHYIIISSDIYVEEIKRNISFYVDIDKISICDDKRTLCFSYTSLEELLFYDSRIKRSLVITSWSCNLDRLIRIFLSVSKKVFPGKKIECFISIGYGSSKVTFCFCVEKKFYIFSIPGLYCRLETHMCHPEERMIRYQFKEKYGIGNGLILYEDDTGILIQYFANSFPDHGNDRYKRAVLEKCYKLHHSNCFLGVHHDLLKEPYEDMSKTLYNTLPYVRDKIEELNFQTDKIFTKINNLNQKPQICHGDLRIDNIVLWNENVFFIDWELMTMTDPMYDVCTFLYFCGDMERRKRKLSYKTMAREIYCTLGKYLSFYYGRHCTDKEYYHAYLIMQAKESVEFLYSSSLVHFIDEDRYEDLLGRIKNSRLFGNG